MSNNTELVPPRSIEAEQALLGSIFLDNAVLDNVAGILPKPAAFYRTKHQLIYGSMQRLSGGNTEIDWVTVKEDLAQHGELEEAGDVEYLQEITEATPSSIGAEQYAAVVRDKALLRWIIASSSEIRGEAYSKLADPRDLAGRLDSVVGSIISATFQRQSQTVAQVLDDVFERIATYQEIAAGGGDAVPGVPSYIRDLDKLLTGFKGGELIILAARPSHGKTSLALNTALRIAARASDSSHGGAAFFSLEMGATELLMRSVCSWAAVDLKKVQTQILTTAEEKDLKHAQEVIGNSQLWIDDNPALTLPEIRAKARMLKRKQGIGIVVVDYLQLMMGDRRLDRYEQVGDISRGLKQLSRELEIPVLALAQLNRNVEQRRGVTARPLLSDLRESGNQEQDSDVVMFLQRENLVPGSKHYSRWHGAPEEPATLIVAKNRNGPIGDVPLKFTKHTTTFDAAPMGWGEPPQEVGSAWDREDAA